MKLSNFQSHEPEEIILLFEKTFSDSEGATEGKFIGKLVRKLIGTTDEKDIFGFCTVNNGTLIGSIFFGRLFLPTEINAFMLSPVAVPTVYQRKGIGQSLINYGLEQLKTEGVELVVTYGDPNYYNKVGFQAISEDILAPPYELTCPKGWQAQSLVSTPISPIQGKSQCVKAFRNQEYW